MIRPLTDADLSRLVELEQELFAPAAWTRGMLAEELRGWGRWYVGIDEPPADDVPAPAGQDGAAPDAPHGAARRLVAYAGLWFDGEVAQVMTIGVARSAQRRGLGARLLAALVTRARELGARSVMLEVRVDNDAAIALYERHGFVTVGRRPRYYHPGGIDALVMELDLGARAGT